MSILSVDIGQKRSGVAISESGILTTPVGLVTGEPALQARALEQIVRDRGVTQLVVGTSRGTLPEYAQNLVHELKALLATDSYRLTIVTVDETLTTKEAERRGAEVSGQSRWPSDVVAAELILEQYLMEGTRAK